jgi:hypothetical protein
MVGRDSWPRLLVLVGLCALGAGVAQAAAVRFHYVPTDSGAYTTMKPAEDGVGERRRWFGAVREPYNCPLRPNHVVTFCHPYTHSNVSVPLALPEGTPNIMHGPDRITFNYGSYAVRVRFLPDGSVDVVYDSGFLRAP